MEADFAAFEAVWSADDLSVENDMRQGVSLAFLINSCSFVHKLLASISIPSPLSASIEGALTGYGRS